MNSSNPQHGLLHPFNLELASRTASYCYRATGVSSNNLRMTAASTTFLHLHRIWEQSRWCLWSKKKNTFQQTMRVYRLLICRESTMHSAVRFPWSLPSRIRETTYTLEDERLVHLRRNHPCFRGKSSEPNHHFQVQAVNLLGFLFFRGRPRQLQEGQWPPWENSVDRGRDLLPTPICVGLFPQIYTVLDLAYPIFPHHLWIISRM